MSLGVFPLGSIPLGGWEVETSGQVLTPPLRLILGYTGGSGIYAQGVKMESFPIRVGDRLPLFTGQLIDGNGVIPDITGATVQLRAFDLNTGETFITGACTITSGPEARFSYAWTTTDVSIPRDAVCSVKVTYPSTLPQTFPDLGDVRLIIRDSY
jgi:hypothetical protein